MATEGSVYQRKDGRWVAQYTDAKGKTRYLYRKTKAEAKKALREALKDRDDNFVPADKIIVGMYLNEWLDERRQIVSYRTWRVQESIIRCRVKPHIGPQRLCKLTGRDVTKLYRRLLTDGLSSSTVGHTHVTHARNPQSSVAGCRSRQVHSHQPIRRPNAAKTEED
jgi:hypothetical protein